MGLTAVLASSAARRAHVLVVEVPGSWMVRAVLERHVVARGWRLATSPAEADALAVCGEPGPQLAEVVARVWDQLPGPRVRIDLDSATDIEAALDRVATGLADTSAHREDARSRPRTPDVGGEETDMAPAGIPLAEGDEDRDGLEMDVLRVRLGPVLPHWPPGLVLRCALQGDLVTGAEVELLDRAYDGPRTDDEPATYRSARRCDAAAQVLALAGWEDAATQARRIRDRMLLDRPGSVDADLDRLRRRVRRSHLLRWSLRGLDVHDRLLAMLEAAATERGRATRPSDQVALTELPTLVEGLDVAVVRLVVASLDLTPVGQGIRHG